MVVHLTIVILSPYQRTLKQSPLIEKMVECRKGMNLHFLAVVTMKGDLK